MMMMSNGLPDRPFLSSLEWVTGCSEEAVRLLSHACRLFSTALQISPWPASLVGSLFCVLSIFVSFVHPHQFNMVNIALCDYWCLRQMCCCLTFYVEPNELHAGSRKWFSHLSESCCKVDCFADWWSMVCVWKHAGINRYGCCDALSGLVCWWV